MIREGRHVCIGQKPQGKIVPGFSLASPQSAQFDGAVEI